MYVGATLFAQIMEFLPWGHISSLSRLLKKSLCGSAGSISGDVLTWIDPSFSVLEPLRESFLAVHFASRV
ncbi:MAG TPA: hypothetical protein VLH56_12035, partial [Dissulfurispiraceae bacterium]|nr:hypothetical protein [Dissulfurispiraceae bacterium]